MQGASESWLVQAYFLVDPGIATPGTAGCEPRPGVPGINTGFYNSVAGSVVDPDPTNDQDCEGLPLIDLDKTVQGPATYDMGLGLWRVDYLITATNASMTAGTYDVLDDFAPGMGITLDTANTVAIYQNDETLDGTPGAFPNDNVIVTDEMLAGLASESWLVQAYFSVDPGTVDPGTAGCTPRPGTPGINTGFYNSVAGSPSDPDPTNDQDCEGLPIIDLDKTVQGPAMFDMGLGLWRVDYLITATNISTTAGTYDVIDTFSPGMGITLDTVNTVAIYQMDETLDGTPGNFPIDDVIVTGEMLAAGSSESWIVEAYFLVDPGQTDPGTSGCDPRPGYPGYQYRLLQRGCGQPG